MPGRLAAGPGRARRAKRVEKGVDRVASARQRVMVGAGAAVGAAVLVGVGLGARPVRSDPLDSQLGGGEGRFAWRGFQLFYASRGRGPRLVFVHSVHAAGSSFEWRRNFRPLADQFEVFALDLLGFGKSDRPPLRYTGRLYVDLLADFLRDGAGGPAVVVASGLSGAYAVRVADQAPELVAGLVLVGPTGARRRAALQRGAARGVEAVLRNGALGEPAFRALVSRPSLSYFLRRRAYADPAMVTHEVVDYYYRSSHQPGARYAPAALLGRALDLDVREPFARLRQPVVLVFGSAARAAPRSEGEALRALNPRARLEVLEGAGALAHEERPEAFNAIVRELAQGAGLAAEAEAQGASRLAGEGR